MLLRLCGRLVGLRIRSFLNPHDTATGRSAGGVQIFDFLGSDMKFGLRIFFSVSGFVFSWFLYANYAQGMQPVLIEMYGSSYKCDASQEVEKNIKEILSQHSEAVFLNCRLKNPLTVKEVEPFGQEFCNQGRVSYYRSLNTMVLNMPMVVINGRYEANSEKVDTAIKAALSLDSVAKIDVRRTGSALEISLEGVSSDAKKGSLFLYSYLPIEHNVRQPVVDSASIDGDSYIATASSAVAFRPVIDLVKLADWNGEPLSFSYSLSGLVNSIYDPGSLGYVAVLHESGSSGPVLAVGELKPGMSSQYIQGASPSIDSDKQNRNLPVTLPNQ